MVKDALEQFHSLGCGVRRNIWFWSSGVTVSRAEPQQWFHQLQMKNFPRNAHYLPKFTNVMEISAANVVASVFRRDIKESGMHMMEER